MSVEQAASLITPKPEEDAPEAAASAPEPEIEADPNPAEDASEAEEPGDGGETEEATEAEAEPVEPPQWWDAEAKAHFAALTPEAQAIVFEQEGKREAIVTKAKQEAAEERKVAKEQIDGVKRLADQLGEFLPKAVETFNQQWGSAPDWAAIAQEYGAEQAFILKTQHEQQQQQLAQLAEAKSRAQAEAYRASVAEEGEKLKGTPLEPIPARQEVGKYLVESGYSSAELDAASARDLLLAHKAMLYDRAQAALKAKPPKTPTPAPAKAPARPAAAQAGTPQTRGLAQISNRFAQTRSVDDAVALLMAKG